MESDPSQFEKYWSKPKRMIKAYVESLALFEGGATPDVIRQGAEELWPGITIVAEILNTDPVLTDPEYPDRISYSDDYTMYALTAYLADGEEVESLSITQIEGSVIASDDTGTPFFDRDSGTPDYMIESFFVRYYLNNDGQVDDLLAFAELRS